MPHTKVGDGDIEGMRARTEELVKKNALIVGKGVYYVDKMKSFRFNWQKGVTKGGLSAKAGGPDDVVAEKEMHEKVKKLVARWG